jgi:hypothetical protein
MIGHQPENPNLAEARRTLPAPRRAGKPTAHFTATQGRYVSFIHAYDRFDEHLYEFQFGRRPFDPDGPHYGIPDSSKRREGYGDARTTRIDDLALKPDCVFGYWFDFGDDWFHQVHVESIDQAIPAVTYPRVINRVGKSPPHYSES